MQRAQFARNVAIKKREELEAGEQERLDQQAQPQATQIVILGVTNRTKEKDLFTICSGKLEHEYFLQDRSGSENSQKINISEIAKR